MKLLILDIDGTITPAWQRGFLPGVAEKLAALPAGVKIALATNQGAPACRDAGWTPRSGEYQSLSEVETRLAQVQADLAAITGESPAMYVALAYQTRAGDCILPAGLALDDPRARVDWRKPEPGMLLAAMADTGVSPDDVLMVGDSESDRLAAAASGVRFIWAKDFFEVAE